MTIHATDLEQRWMDEGSDAPPELQAALRSLLEEPQDTARIARLEARLAPLLGVAPQPDLPAASGPHPAPSGAAGSGRLLSAGKLGALLLSAGMLAATVRALVHRAADESAGTPRAAVAQSAASVLPVHDGAPPRLGTPELVPRAPVSALPIIPGPAPARPRQETASMTSIAEEARLLQEARSKLFDSPEQALSLLAAHRRRYPRSTLGGEREFFTIQALVRAGRTTEAADRLARFRAESPSSPYLAAATRAVTGGGHGEK